MVPMQMLVCGKHDTDSNKKSFDEIGTRIEP
jgi:hypothetical protein